MPDDKLPFDTIEFEAGDFQYDGFYVDCNDGKHEDVTLEYDGEEYGIEIQNGKPVVVANE